MLEDRSPERRHPVTASPRHPVTASPRHAVTAVTAVTPSHRRGQVPEARLAYLRAFLEDPASVDLERLADPEVAGLPSVAANEHEIPGDCLDWVAAVGTTERLLPLPAATLPGLDVHTETASSRCSPGREFYQWLLRERRARTHEDRVTARREMQRLCPSLLLAYLRRFR